MNIQRSILRALLTFSFSLSAMNQDAHDPLTLPVRITTGDGAVLHVPQNIIKNCLTLKNVLEDEDGNQLVCDEGNPIELPYGSETFGHVWYALERKDQHALLLKQLTYAQREILFNCIEYLDIPQLTLFSKKLFVTVMNQLTLRVRFEGLSHAHDTNVSPRMYVSRLPFVTRDSFIKNIRTKTRKNWTEYTLQKTLPHNARPLPENCTRVHYENLIIDIVPWLFTEAGALEFVDNEKERYYFVLNFEKRKIDSLNIQNDTLFIKTKHFPFLEKYSITTIFKVDLPQFLNKVSEELHFPVNELFVNEL